MEGGGAYKKSNGKGMCGSFVGGLEERGGYLNFRLRGEELIREGRGLIELLG